MTPSAVHVGNIVQGARLAWAQGRDIGMLDEDSDTARKVRNAFSLKATFLDLQACHFIMSDSNKKAIRLLVLLNP